MNSRKLAVGVVLLLIVGAQALADDLYPAPWRTTPPGQGTTTFQQWEFNTAANPAAPEVVFNSFGAPSAQISGQFPLTRWLATDWAAPTHHGVWKFELPDAMTLTIPNSPVQHEFKDIWLQVTYYTFQGLDPVVTTNPGASVVEVVHKTQLDDYYWHDTFHIRIEPNPSSETISIKAPDAACTIYVDEVVVDTISIPEPGSLVLALAGLLLRRR